MRSTVASRCLCGLNRKAEGVAKSERPDGAVCPYSPLVKWVAPGNRAVIVYAQYLPLQVAQGLRVLAISGLTHSHIELAVLRGLFYGDALGEVAWLVHIEVAVLGDAVGEELQWYAEHERLQHLWRIGDREHDAGNPTGGLVVLAGYR